jgi:hypothetical protein
MTRSPGPRATVNLSDSVYRHLNTYALSASAAGVGILALAQSAEGKIVYTPAHVVIHRGWPGTVFVDLDHDGNADFKFENWWNSTSSVGPSGDLSVFPAQQGNGILGYGTAGHGSFVYFASALRTGAQIGPKRQFFHGKFNNWMFRASVGWGQWKDVKNRYLGFKFAIKGKTHYGWARLNVSSNPQNYKITATLTGYAYETTPNRAIVAGKETGTDVADLEQPESATLTAPFPRSAALGELAIGASGLAIWRRDESVGAKE